MTSARKSFMKFVDFPAPKMEGLGSRGHGLGGIGFAASGPFCIVNFKILGSEAWVPQ